MDESVFVWNLCTRHTCSQLAWSEMLMYRYLKCLHINGHAKVFSYPSGSSFKYFTVDTCICNCIDKVVLFESFQADRGASGDACLTTCWIACASSGSNSSFPLMLLFSCNLNTSIFPPLSYKATRLPWRSVSLFSSFHPISQHSLCTPWQTHSEVNGHCRSILAIKFCNQFKLNSLVIPRFYSECVIGGFARRGLFSTSVWPISGSLAFPGKPSGSQPCKSPSSSQPGPTWTTLSSHHTFSSS